jgi:DASH complex subunit DAD2
MAYGPRPTAIFPSESSTGSSLRQPSIGSQNPQQSSALAARIAAKRSELENLKQLKELSGALAAQMGALEEKLATLRDGTEGWASPVCNRGGKRAF